MSDLRCGVEGCESLATNFRWGWCHKHYMRWRRHGDVTVTHPNAGKDCSEEGCARPAYCRGWCVMHYARVKRYGDPKTVHPRGKSKQGKPWAGKTLRACRACGESYMPVGRGQRYCQVCVETPYDINTIKRYGLTAPDRRKLLERQGGTCALCSREPRAVDHDHVTGATRGLLCVGCNTRLSIVENNEAWITRARAYLEFYRQRGEADELPSGNAHA